MAAIKKDNSSLLKDNLVIIASKFSDDKKYGLSKEESNYISTQLKADKKLVAVNQFNRHIFVVIADEKAEAYKRNEKLRKAGNQIGGMLNEAKKTGVTITAETNKASDPLAVAEGMALGNYQFILYKTKAAKEKHSLTTIGITGKVNDKDISDLNHLVTAVATARDLVNEPPNVLNAEELSARFKKMGKEAGFSVEVFNKAKIVSLKMGGLLSVNRGSVDPPTFTIMEYKPKSAKNKKPIVLVGKGVTYDTGGLSLKPTPNSMDMMKCDMAGAAAVGATMYAIAKAKLNVHVIGLVPATDNRPGFNAFAPGDVITMYDGTTVEMLNSDAEGRMILADALTYAKKYKPELVIDLATLTGAAANAIGPQGIVSMGTADDKTTGKLKVSGEQVYERLAEFPFWEEYDDLIKSDVADVKNIGGPQAGAITAGRFLLRFTDYPYIHLDIAGPAFLTARYNYQTKGGTGVGVRLLFDFLKNM
ncbi:MAG: peptidase [Bacteroidetes bacterium]|jgi:leucyl aminopeptidase|nr:peptidase [Bacteroidota bacterium]